MVSEQKHPINWILGNQSRPKGRNNPKRMGLLLSLGWDPGDQASPTPADVRVQGLSVWVSPGRHPLLSGEGPAEIQAISWGPNTCLVLGIFHLLFRQGILGFLPGN